MNHQELVAGLKKLHLHAIAKDYAEVARICEGEKKTGVEYPSRSHWQGSLDTYA